MCSFPFHTCDSFNNYLKDTVSKISDPAQASETSGDSGWGAGEG